MSRDERGARLGVVARRQHGIFTRRQAIDTGYTEGEVDGRVRRGDWVAVDRGVYRAVQTPDAWHQQLLAACLVGPAVASHRSAAALWGFPDFDTGVVEVTALRHRRRHRDGIVWHESRVLDDRDITVIDAIPVTHATRTILDLGAVLDVETLLHALDDGVRRGLTSLERIERELERWGDRRLGSRRVRRALALRCSAAVPESVLETEFDAFIRREGLPQPVRQWPIIDRDGRFRARVDFAYPHLRLAIELESKTWHGGSHWERDLSRYTDLGSLDWALLLFTTRDLRGRPAWVKQKLLMTMDARRAYLGVPLDGQIRTQG